MGAKAVAVSYTGVIVASCVHCLLRVVSHHGYDSEAEAEDAAAAEGGGGDGAAAGGSAGGAAGAGRTEAGATMSAAQLDPETVFMQVGAVRRL